MKRDLRIDFIRIIATIGVIVYHFSVYSNSSFNLRFGPNVWNVFFFMIAGFLAYRKYDELECAKDVCNFYKNKIIRIFPIFYMVWLYFHIETSIINKRFFYAGKPLNMIFTFLGIDGYLSQRFTTYYQVGEWFLGAIIICYLLYPIVLNIYKKNKTILLLSLFALYSLYEYLNIPRISVVFPSVVECVFKFSLGMLFYDLKDKMNNKYVIISALFIVLVYPNLVGYRKYLIIKTLYYYSCLIIFYFAGCYFTEKFKIGEIISKLSNLSFVALLLQHKIIYKLLQIYNPQSFIISVMLIILILLLCFVLSFIINYILHIIKSKLSHNNTIYKQ